MDQTIKNLEAENRSLRQELASALERVSIEREFNNFQYNQFAALDLHQRTRIEELYRDIARLRLQLQADRGVPGAIGGAMGRYYS
jgi:hypothetical protein